MDGLTDILLNGDAFVLAPGGYTRQAENPARAEPQRQQLSRFELGLGIAQDDELPNDQGGGWSGLNVHAVGGGSGVEPFGPVLAHTDSALVDLPSTTQRAHGAVAGSNAFVGLGRRIYKSVLLSSGTWSNFTAAADLGAGFAVSGLAYYQDDLLVLLSTGQDIRKFNTVTNSLTVWRSGERGQVGVGYKGQLVYAPRLANEQDELRLSGTRWNGNAVTHIRNLDSPIVNMALFNGEVVVATKTSLYRMGGDPYPGEPDDATVSADTSKAAEWRGDPEPLLTHGQFVADDDFVFLCSYRGRLYTWLAGQVAEYDGGQTWAPIGPRGIVCHGGVVVGDWLLVALQARDGTHEAWGFDGVGWWRLLARASPAALWPCPLGGAGDRDAVVFRSGTNTYDLLRLRWRSASVNTYAAAAEWVTPLLTGGDAGADKAWRRLDAWFAWPEVPGNAASADTVSIALDYSLDAGATWTQVDSETVTVGRQHALSHQFATPPVSRLLQLRVRWLSVSDWAPILTHVDVDLAPIDSAPKRQRWTLEVRVPDQLAGSGRVAIDNLWDAWRAGASVAFRDLDYATDPTERQVRVLDVQEQAPRAGNDAGDWDGGTVVVELSEL